MNCNITDNFKLKLDFIVATINEDTSLDELNFSIKKFIDKFREELPMEYAVELNRLLKGDVSCKI